ncbi:MAG: hypothetical protein ACYS26_12170 [Planctomycetota bacterium]|jgi:hypothetical protein
MKDFQRCATLTLAVALTTSLATAQTLQVPGQFANIQSAINTAPAGATIEIAPGTYSITAPLNTFGKDVTLVGVGGPDVTFLDGGGTSRIFRFFSGESPDMVIQDLTLRNGQAPTGGGTVGDGGGGVLIQNSSPTFLNCVFEGCEADNGINATATTQSYRGGHGGAVYVEFGGPTFDRCVFRANKSGNGGDGADGADGANGIAGSSDGKDGKNGSAGSVGGAGSAIFAYRDDTIVNVYSCVFDGNETGKGGEGGYGGDGGDAYLVLGVYLGDGGDGGDHGAGGDGGAGTIYASTGAFVNVRNCTFVNNKTGRGTVIATAGSSGGLGFSNGSPGASSLVNDGDQSPYSGVFIDGVSLGNVYNSLFFDSLHVQPGIPLIELFPSSAAQFSAFRDTAHGIGSMVITQSYLDGFYVPSLSSPLIDAGSDSLVSAAMSGDLDGGSRILDRPGVGAGNGVDIGAQENSRGEWIDLASLCNQNDPGSLIVTGGAPTIGESVKLAVHDPTFSTPPGSVALLAGSAQFTGYPCGLSVPGWGMVPGQPGYSILLADSSYLIYGFTVWNGAPVEYTLPVPNNPDIVGLYWYFQGAVVDVPNFDVGLTEGRMAYFGD